MVTSWPWRGHGASGEGLPERERSGFDPRTGLRVPAPAGIPDTRQRSLPRASGAGLPGPGAQGAVSSWRPWSLRSRRAGPASPTGRTAKRQLAPDRVSTAEPPVCRDAGGQGQHLADPAGTVPSGGAPACDAPGTWLPGLAAFENGKMMFRPRLESLFSLSCLFAREPAGLPGREL